MIANCAHTPHSSLCSLCRLRSSAGRLLAFTSAVSHTSPLRLHTSYYRYMSCTFCVRSLTSCQFPEKFCTVLFLTFALPVFAVKVATLGTPRIGLHRELKMSLEAYWAGKIPAESLLTTSSTLRRANWERQKQRGVTIIPSNDFSLYDHVLDAAVLFGVVPEVYGWNSNKSKHVPLDVYFAMARGNQHSAQPQHHHLHPHAASVSSGVPALEMTKWFDTNYHFIVPEFSGADQTFSIGSSKPVDEFLEAKKLGYHTRPVLLGPITFLKLGKLTSNPSFNTLTLLPRLLPIYTTVLKQLVDYGADWVQIDEPSLVLDLTDEDRAAYRSAFEFIAKEVPQLQIMLTTYFGAVTGANLDLVASLPIAGLHVDAVRSTPAQLDQVVERLPLDRTLSLGVIDGRNIWRADLHRIVNEVVKPVIEKRRSKDLVQVAPSCSLLHVPVDLDLEQGLTNIKQWLSFSVQKMTELHAISEAAVVSDESALPASVQDTLAASASACASRKASLLIHNPAVSSRVASLDPSMYSRHSPYSARTKFQRDLYQLPDFPTTTIGSFPQTSEVRKARAAFAAGTMSEDEYTNFLREQVAKAIRWQEEIGLDVLVHGEFERNDMVQYFGELLKGFAFTTHGWVQSYGSRCVRPPIIYGDVSRDKPMTVEWWKFAQSLTKKPVKGMLTGPVTMLNWSFVRDDIPRDVVCTQLALAIRDEVLDLEKAGAKMIQIDEAALREGLPLLKSDWPKYLSWAIDCFRLCSAGVADATQIHTHMCYSEFNAIIDSISKLDADVLSIETSRSKMELLDAFKTTKVSIIILLYSCHYSRFGFVFSIPTKSALEFMISTLLEFLK